MVVDYEKEAVVVAEIEERTLLEVDQIDLV
jgi:hypothetical protein